jgi:hypothetical protein
MRPSKVRYVTACQQLLALGAVLAVLAPAAGVISLDVVIQHPGAPATARVRVEPAAATTSDARPARVPEGRVDAVDQEYSLTPKQGSHATPDGRALLTKPAVGRTEVLSRPEAVAGFGTVGVTWSNTDQLADGDITIEVRTRKDGAWSAWNPMPYDADHAPDPGSQEARNARPGTDAVVVGDVDQVQVKAVTSTGTAPADMKLAVIAPGKAAVSEVQAPAIDTARIEQSEGAPGQPSYISNDASVSTELPVATDTGGQDTLALAAGTFTTKPKIFSRAQWGADERLRDPGSLHYYEVHAGFVHHTVNANDYTRDEVPGILRSIYAYHTQSKGWSDIGYNFLVDRFGRIWEGRYGGVALPVVGAHTLGYNDYSFAMSAIGNYEIAKPSAVMLDAYARLFAWKLSLHGVDVSSTKQWVGSRYFQAINGHRDAGQTLCPGKYLYAKLPYIRTLAAKYQQSWAGRQRDVNAVSTPYPDIFLRSTSDNAGYLLPTQGLLRLRAPRVSDATGWSGMDTIIATPDVTGDGKTDLFARDSVTGTAMIYPGDGTGHFGAGIKPTNAFKGFDQITAVGDLNHDGRKDLVGRNPATGRLRLFYGTGGGGFASKLWSNDWAGYDKTIGTGDFNGDGFNDLLARGTSGALWLVPGKGRDGLGAPVRLAGKWGGFDVLTGYGDYNHDGRPDLFARNARSGNGFVFPNLGGNKFGHWFGPLETTGGVAALSSGGNVVDGGPADLVGRKGDALVVLAHSGTWNTSAPAPVQMNFGNATKLLSVGDWDRDGDGDLIVRTVTGKLMLRLSNDDGTFAAPQQIASGFDEVGLLSAVGDMTGDGYPDLMGQPTGGAMRIYPGRGAAGLGVSYVAHSAISASRQYGVGLWDGDGAPDSLFRVDNRLVLYPGNGPGGLTSSESLGTDVSAYDWVLGVGDISDSGHPDLIVRAKKTGYLWLLPGTASGFGDRVFLAQGFGGYNLAG